MNFASPAYRAPTFTRVPAHRILIFPALGLRAVGEVAMSYDAIGALNPAVDG